MNENDSATTVEFHDPATTQRGGGMSNPNECGAAISNDRMERFLAAFEASARRWEIIVYPALFAFVVLAGYGFYLVFSLTKDVSVLAQSVERSMATNLQVVAARMEDVSDNVANMSKKMDKVSEEMEKISGHVSHVDSMSRDMGSVSRDITAINQRIGHMAGSTDQMRYDLGSMNRSISPPMSFMRGFIPW